MMLDEMNEILREIRDLMRRMVKYFELFLEAQGVEVKKDVGIRPPRKSRE